MAECFFTTAAVCVVIRRTYLRMCVFVRFFGGATGRA
jgi:hypothetical protein